MFNGGDTNDGGARAPREAGPPAGPPPGWHPDPEGRATHRFWDGTQWTSHVSVDGQSFDEAATPVPSSPQPQSEHPTHGVAARPVEVNAGVVLAEDDPAMRQLAAEPYLTYHERDPGVHGGRIDITGVDGTILASAEGDKPTRSSGWGAEALRVDLTRPDGGRLGALVRPRSSEAVKATHAVFDAHDVQVGEFATVPGAMGTPWVVVRTGAGEVGRLGYATAERFIVDASGQPLIRCLQTANHNRMENRLRAVRRPDEFVVERLGPTPAWLFLFGLLMPIDTNLRLDRDRREKGNHHGL